MPGIFVDHQLCPGHASGNIDAVLSRYRGIAVTVGDEAGYDDSGTVLWRLAIPSLDRLELPQEPRRCRAFVPGHLAFLQSAQTYLSGLPALGIGRKETGRT